MSRPNWDSVWMSCAKTISERSYDPRYKVGAIVVTDDNTQVLSVGYNGNYSGGPNKIESESPGESGMLHAEIIIQKEKLCMLLYLLAGCVPRLL